MPYPVGSQGIHSPDIFNIRFVKPLIGGAECIGLCLFKIEQEFYVIIVCYRSKCFDNFLCASLMLSLNQGYPAIQILPGRLLEKSVENQ
jgi:hypothetical protein